MSSDEPIWETLSQERTKRSATSRAAWSAMRSTVQESARVSDAKGFKGKFAGSVLYSPQAMQGIVGLQMDRATSLIEATTEEVREAKKELERLHDEMGKVSDVLLPELAGYLKRIRDTRMAVATETHQTLTLLRDVRHFFMQHEYEEEMARLERFVGLCKQMREVMDDGTFTAVCDTALRLADGGKK